MMSLPHTELLLAFYKNGQTQHTQSEKRTSCEVQGGGCCHITDHLAQCPTRWVQAWLFLSSQDDEDWGNVREPELRSEQEPPLRR